MKANRETWRRAVVRSTRARAPDGQRSKVEGSSHRRPEASVNVAMDFDITTARPAGPRPAAPVAAPQQPGGTQVGSAHHHPPGAGGASTSPPVAPEDVPASIFITGVSPAVNDGTLREFLECCGPLRSLAQFGDVPLPGQPRQYVATYADVAAAQSSLVLNNMTLVDRPITVVAAERAVGPGGALDLSKGGSSAVPSGADLLNPLASMEQAVMTGLVEDPLKLWRQAAEKLPSWFPAGYKRCALFVPIPHLINGAMAAAEARIEFEKEVRDGAHVDDSDVSRTVYAGNVNSSITEDMLADFFSIAGNVTYVKFAGSEFNPSRFGFVEFDTKVAAESAKALTGTQVAEMTLKVKHSNNPIVKDRMRNFWGTCRTERRRRMIRERKQFKRKERELLRGGESSSESESESSSSSSEERRRRRRRRREREERDRDEKKSRDKDADEGGDKKERKSSREKKEDAREKKSDEEEDEKKLREEARRSRKSRRKSEGEGKEDAA